MGRISDRVMGTYSGRGKPKEGVPVKRWYKMARQLEGSRRLTGFSVRETQMT